MKKYIYGLIFRKRKVRRGLPKMKNPPPPPPRRPKTTQTLYDNKQLDNAIDAWDKLTKSIEK